jgi:hypothetical protein
MKMRRSLVETAFMLELEHSLPTPKKSFDAIVEHVDLEPYNQVYSRFSWSKRFVVGRRKSAPSFSRARRKRAMLADRIVALRPGQRLLSSREARQDRRRQSRRQSHLPRIQRHRLRRRGSQVSPHQGRGHLGRRQ